MIISISSSSSSSSSVFVIVSVIVIIIMIIIVISLLLSLLLALLLSLLFVESTLGSELISLGAKDRTPEFDTSEIIADFQWRSPKGFPAACSNGLSSCQWRVPRGIVTSPADFHLCLKGDEDALARAWPDGQSQSGAQCRGDGAQKKSPSEMSSRRLAPIACKEGVSSGMFRWTSHLCELGRAVSRH